MSYDNNDPDRTRFALFPNKYKKSDNHPSLKGSIEINRELLITMNEKVKASGFPLKMDVALWDEQQSKDGQHNYRSGSFQMGWTKDDDSSGGGSSNKGDKLPTEKAASDLTVPDDSSLPF